MIHSTWWMETTYGVRIALTGLHVGVTHVKNTILMAHLMYQIEVSTGAMVA